MTLFKKMLSAPVSDRTNGTKYVNGIDGSSSVGNRTWTDVPIGDPAVDRRLIIIGHAARYDISTNGRSMAICKVDGVNIPVSDITQSHYGDISIAVKVFEAIVPTGSIADIYLETGSGVDGETCDPWAIAVVALYGGWAWDDGRSIKRDSNTEVWGEAVTSTTDSILIASALWENSSGATLGDVNTEYNVTIDNRQFIFGTAFIAGSVSKTITFDKNTTATTQMAIALGMWKKT